MSDYKVIPLEWGEMKPYSVVGTACKAKTVEGEIVIRKYLDGTFYLDILCDGERFDLGTSLNEVKQFASDYWENHIRCFIASTTEPIE